MLKKIMLIICICLVSTLTISSVFGLKPQNAIRDNEIDKIKIANDLGKELQPYITEMNREISEEKIIGEI